MADATRSRPYTVIVEGNIGSGKSTFLQHLEGIASDGEVKVLAEPVHKWRDLRGHNLLELMYTDPGRWSSTFQSYAQLTMMELHVQQCTSKMKVMERSIYSGRHCFIENLYRSGKIHPSEYSVLDEWFRFLTSPDLKSSKTRFDLGVDLIVYLRTDPEVAWNRVKNRSRKEEKVIPLEYLEQLHELHESWLMDGAGGSNDGSRDIPAPVWVVDANEDILQTPDTYTKHGTRILQDMKIKGTTQSWQRRVLGELNR